MEKIIIDCDPGIDDFAALLFAVRSNKLDILGVTTVAGNCTVENGTINALKALELAGNENIPVYQGASKALKIEEVDATYVHGSNGLGGISFEMPKRKPEKESAVEFLIRAVSENPGEITIVPMGALTNIALAIQKDKDFVKNVKSVVLMGGAEGKGNVTETAEFNFYKDPDAAKIVFEAGFKELVMLGLDITRKVVLHPCLEQFLLQEGGELGKFWYDISRTGAAFDIETEGVDGSIINDPVTIGYIIAKDMIKVKDAFVEISLEENNLGQSIVYNHYNELGKMPNCKVAYDIEDTEFLRLILKTIFKDKEDNVDKFLNK